MSTKPQLVVFDLDYTLCPFWVESNVTPPFRKKILGTVVDARNAKIKYYNEVPRLLKKLHNKGYKLGVASRTNATEGANQLLQLFHFHKYFHFKEIYPDKKTEHFSCFKKNSGIDYKDMLFFDDENRNIVDINKIGVVSILVKNGMNLNILKNGLEEYRQKRS